MAIKIFREVAKSGLNPERELHALARLDHPGIVPVYDTGSFEGRPYFVAKYVRGPNAD